MRFLSEFLVVLMAVGLLTTGCAYPSASPDPAASPPAGGLSVIATSTVFADLVREVGGSRVTVHPLVPPGAEVHTFDPAPSDAAVLATARLLVMNGLELDDWLLPFAQQSGATDIPVLKLAENIDEVEYVNDEETGTANPHLWMNPAYTRIYVDRIRLKLIELDPAGQATYDANAEDFDSRLVALDQYARQQIDAIPAANRRVLSSHDAFPYFARAYGLELIAVVVDVPGQEPSAADVAALANEIRQSNVKAILSEVQFSDEVVRSIGEDTGATVVSDLYTDSLGDPPLNTYEAAIRHDVDLIVSALKQ